MRLCLICCVVFTCVCCAIWCVLLCGFMCVCACSLRLLETVVLMCVIMCVILFLFSIWCGICVVLVFSGLHTLCVYYVLVVLCALIACCLCMLEKTVCYDDCVSVLCFNYVLLFDIACLFFWRVYACFGVLFLCVETVWYYAFDVSVVCALVVDIVMYAACKCL